VLVLSAKPEDGVQIGEHVRITVIDVRPRNVRIGIEAPKSIAIRRDPASTRSGPASNRAAGRSAEDRCAGKAEPSANAQRACDPATADQTPMAVMVVSRD
jgi:carbon storage regulator CsrA